MDIAFKMFDKVIKKYKNIIIKQNKKDGSGTLSIEEIKALFSFNKAIPEKVWK